MTRFNQPALTAPQHVFDLPRATVWLLAAVGHASLQGAQGLDAALNRTAHEREQADRPRARLGPSQRVQSDHLIPDSWRVR